MLATPKKVIFLFWEKHSTKGFAHLCTQREQTDQTTVHEGSGDNGLRYKQEFQ